MSFYIIGGLIITTLLVSIVLIVLRREKELKSSFEARKEDLRIVEKLISHAKLHNDGKSIDQVISNLKMLNIEYKPKNSL